MPPKASAAKVAAAKKRPAAAPQRLKASKRAELEDEEAEEEDEEEAEEEDEEEEEQEQEQEEPPQASSPVGRGRAAASRPSASFGSPGRRSVGRADQEESPAAAAARAMHIVSGPGSKSPKAAASPKATEAGSQLVAKKDPNRLDVQYNLPETGVKAPLEAGLVRLQRDGKLCDAAVVTAAGRIPVHRVVLAAHSETLSGRVQGAAAELDLRPAAPTPIPGTASIAVGPGPSHEAAELLVRWLYGEVDAGNYFPSSHKVNEELLQLSSELSLPLLSELCALRLAADADTTNVASRVRLCEDFGLPRLRSALVFALVEDAHALDTVARDPTTLGHPALMRELLAVIATKANIAEEEGQNERPAKRSRNA